jgi:hypothetical protein
MYVVTSILFGQENFVEGAGVTNPMRFTLCLLAGFLLTFVLLACVLMFPGFEHIGDVVLEPAGWILRYGPGGKEDPFLLLVAIPAQVVTYALLMYLPIALVSRVRRGPPNKNVSILQ